MKKSNLTFGIIYILCILHVSILQGQSVAPERPGSFDPYIFKHLTVQLKKQTKQHLIRAKMEMEEIGLDTKTKTREIK